MFFLLLCLAGVAYAESAGQQQASYFANVRALEAREALHPDAAIENDLALNFFLLGQHELFHAAIAKALEIEPGSAQAYYLAGRFALEAEQNPKDASRAFQKALDLAPASFKSHYYLGISLRQLTRFQAAREEFQKAAESATYSWPFNALAETELDLNNPQAALTAALKAIEIEPQSAENVLLAGRVYQSLNQTEKAIQMYQQAATLDPLWEMPHFRLASVYAARPDTQKLREAELEQFEKLKGQETPMGAAAASRSQPLRRAPQAKSRAELDAFGAIPLATGSLAIVRASEEFLSRFPGSEFQEKALESEFEAFRERNDYAAARRVASAVLTLNPTNASVLAESALMIADKNDASSFALGAEYSARAIETANGTAKPDRMSRAEFREWKNAVLASAFAAQGLLALRRNDPASALVSLKQVIQLRPDGAGYLRLAEAYAMKGDEPHAREAFAHAESLGPPVVAQAARQEAASLPSRTEGSVAGRFERARALEKEGKLQQAAAEYELVMRQDPQLAEAFHNLGLIYYRLGDYQRSAERLRTALQIKPRLLGADLFLGLSEFRLGEFQDSAKHLEVALQLEPGNREAYLFLFRDQVALGQFGPETAREALRRFPTDSELNYAVGLASLERIREISRAANELGPESAAFLWLSLRRAEERRQDEFVQKYRQRTTGIAEPKLIREYDMLADLLKRCFDVVLSHTPDSAAAHSIRGYLHESGNQVDEALAEYTAAGDHFAAGRLLAQNVRLSEAEVELRAAVAADPQNDRAKADLGRLYLQEDQLDQARVLLRQIVTRYPGDAFAWADLGKAEGKLGARETAIQALQKALELNPSLNQVHYQLAMLYRQQGNEKLALQELQKFQTNRSPAQ